jgi:hypothetical protein
MINAFIGLMMKKLKMDYKLFVGRDYDYMSYLCLGKGGFPIIEDDIYKVVRKSERFFDQTHVPIAHQILDLEAWELYKINKFVLDNNCKIEGWNTDNVQFSFSKQLTSVKKIEEFVNNEFWDDDKKVLKYKFEVKDIVRNYKEQGEYNEYKFEGKKWNNLYVDDGSDDFDKVAEKLINADCSFQIQGMAGTGKSTLCKALIKQLEGKKYRVLCPTNKACRVYDDAMTIHKFYSMHKVGKCKMELDYIFIDEKSMITETFFKALYLMKKNGCKTKFIIAGDWGQLPPVGDKSEYDYKNSELLFELCDGQMVELTKCRRSDKKLFDACVSLEGEFDNKECRRSLCYYNKKRKDINRYWMEKEKNKLCKLIKKNPYDELSQDMYIYKGLPIISGKNCKKYDLANGDEYIIERISSSEKYIILSDGDNEKEIPRKVFMEYFYPAYCITVHKSQGCTFNEPYTIYNWNKLEKSSRYVALSRGTKYEFVNVLK